jgi:hypothetical protein
MKDMDELFKEWRPLVLADSDHFVEDGIICHETWNSVNRRILFILKETNDYEGNISKLINDAVRVRPKSKLWLRPTFHNIGRWAYGLLNFPEDVNSYKEANKERKKSLLSCSFINIKKTSGTRTAGKGVELNAIKYASFLRRQIEILSPDIIVFGGTFQTMKDHVLPEMQKKSHRVHKFNNIICINANHPACTKKRILMYDQVVSNYANYIAENA